MSAADRAKILVHTDPMAAAIREPAKWAPPQVGLAHWLASSTAMDALELGCRDVSIRVIGEWIVVSAEMNWLNRGAGAGLRIADAFHHPLPLVPPEKRTSSSPTRHEAWLRVYAKSIVVVDGALIYQIKGDGLPEECRTAATEKPFCVAFQVTEGFPGKPGNDIEVEAKAEIRVE